MKIALLQINPTVGDLEGNAKLILEATRRAEAQGAELVLTPELALMGYLPRDLLLKPAFVQKCGEQLRKLAVELTKGPALLVGCAEPNTSHVGRALHNSAALLQNGRMLRAFHKTLLPTYDVFDEDRYFEPAREAQVLDFKGLRLGVSICEDLWNDRDFWQRRRYHTDPVEQLAVARVDAIVNLSASPFVVGKQRLRQRMLARMAARHAVPILYCNQVGGNDDLIFDGRSFAVDAKGHLLVRGAAFAPDVVMVDLNVPGTISVPEVDPPEEEIFAALTLGLRDFVRKCGFSKVHLGLSGGIDSTLVAILAVEALGADNVMGVLMPSPYSSKGSVDDALDLAKRLGIKTYTVPISGPMEAFTGALAPVFAGSPPGVTEENIQARIRGTLLMALSNKFGSMLLTTGNKSELAVGYCTLYGDMNGGLAVISDVPKTMVYRICQWLNRTRQPTPVPVACIDKPPSAELRANQTDQDSLPPYDQLDAILELHIEQHQAAEQIIARGQPAEIVNRVINLVRGAEFKRKQAAPGLKVTDRAFGSGWRMPIARK